LKTPCALRYQAADLLAVVERGSNDVADLVRCLEPFTRDKVGGEVGALKRLLVRHSRRISPWHHSRTYPGKILFVCIPNEMVCNDVVLCLTLNKRVDKLKSWLKQSRVRLSGKLSCGIRKYGLV
jgi:hypothetical protein